MPGAAQRVVAFVFCVATSCAQGVAADPAWLVSASTILGGHPAAADIDGIAIDPQGSTVVVATLASSRFLGVDSGRITNGGAGARAVIRLDGAGTVRSVNVVGLPAIDVIDRTADAFRGLALDAVGNAYVLAYDAPFDVPAGGRWRAASARPHIVRVPALGAPVRYPAVLDPAIRRVAALAVDGTGNVFVAGSAFAGLATTAGAPYPVSAVAPGCMAPFVAKFSPSSSAPVYATYLAFAGTAGVPCGDTSPVGPFDAGAFAIAIDAAGNAFVAGQAEPGARATSGAVDLAPASPTLYHGRQIATHAFVTKVDATGTAIAWSARLGGSNRERATAIALDPAGGVYVAGKTTSPDFPSFAAVLFRPFVWYTCLLNTPELGFVVKLAGDGSRIAWSGLLPAAGSALDDCGGPPDEQAPVVLALDTAGNVMIAAYTVSSNRTANVSRNAINASQGDAFFAQVSPTGSVDYATWLSLRARVRGIAIDAAGNARIAGGGFLRQLSAGRRPVETEAPAVAACAAQPVPLRARVAAAGDLGSVEFRVNGSAVAFAALRRGAADVAVPLVAGVHRIDAVYRGATIFDGRSAPTTLVAVNQAGACN